MVVLEGGCVLDLRGEGSEVEGSETEWRCRSLWSETLSARDGDDKVQNVLA